MMKNPSYILIILAGLLLALTAPACYFIAERNNPNDLKNLNEDMGYPVADTGQTSCWDSDGNIINPCDENPAGWPLQDGYYGSVEASKPNARSFSGPTQHLTYTSDYTTKDNVTGLVWRSCSEGWAGSDCLTDDPYDNKYTWVGAKDACKKLNSWNGSDGYAGRKTWRLPTIVELSTLPNYGVIPPALAIDAAYFPNTPNTPTSNYWSSRSEVSYASNALIVDFIYGNVYYDTKTNYNYVRCVADGP